MFWYYIGRLKRRRDKTVGGIQFSDFQKMFFTFCIIIIRKSKQLKRTRDTETNQMVFLDFSNDFSLKSYSSFLKIRKKSTFRKTVGKSAATVNRKAAKL